jgi:hypothetical protein
VNATTDLPNVSNNQFIELQVQVNGSTAVVVSDERTPKVSLCHAEGNGTYHLIDISQSAESDHRAHGDARIGEAVPGQPTKTFDSNCRPVGPSIDIEKLTNGQDADTAPGPEVFVGTTVTWTYVVKNTGTIDLSAIVVSDNRGVAVNCSGQTSLAPNASMTCTGTGVATIGQYSNIGSVTANWSNGGQSGTVTDSDASHYLGVVPQQSTSTAKVTLCHRTGAGFYNLLTVDVDAEPAHRAHGDAKPGEAVPGVQGKTFSPGCALQ